MIPFIFFILPAILAIALLLKAGKRRPWCRVTGILLLLLFSGILVQRNGHIARFKHNSDPVELPAKNALQLSEDIPSIWLPGVEDQFEADVYPSQKSAVQALRSRAKVPTDVNINILAEEPHPAPWSDSPKHEVQSGTLETTFLDQDAQTTLRADFVEKPWVDNFADFVNRNPKDTWILALSQEPCTSQAEAEEQALRNACSKLTVLLNQTYKHRFTMEKGFTVTDADIRNRSLIQDRFAQSFSGASSRIWREAILINASPEKLAELAKYKILTQRSWRTKWIRECISAAGIMILLYAVYLFLNAATRGYYTWSLRIVAVILILAGIWLVFALY